MKYVALEILFITLSLRCFSQTNSLAAHDYINLYQQYVSNQKNSRCAMYPTCSVYGKDCFQKYNFFKAFTLTCDRLTRCSHDSKFYDISYNFGYKCLLDLNDSVNYNKLIHDRFAFPHTDVLKRRKGRNDTLLFINQLINKEEYELALLEIERNIYLKKLESNYFKLKLLCLRGLKKYEKGIFEYETEFPQCIQNLSDIKMQAALLYYCCSNFHKVNELMISSISNKKTQENKRMYALYGVSLLQEGKYNESKNIFKNSIFEKRTIQRNLKLIESLENIKLKKPILAKILSIIPGGGYAYTKHIGSAITSFAINSLLGYATYTSIKRKNYGVAGICGFLTCSFYIGNINGAGRSATRYNNKMKENIIKKLERINNIFIN